MQEVWKTWKPMQSFLSISFVTSFILYIHDRSSFYTETANLFGMCFKVLSISFVISLSPNNFKGYKYIINYNK